MNMTAERPAKPSSEPDADGGSGVSDELADALLAAFGRRSSRKVLAARLAVEQGQKDLGDVVDAMAAEQAAEHPLLAEVDEEFAFGAERRELAELIGRELDADEPGP